MQSRQGESKQTKHCCHTRVELPTDFFIAASRRCRRCSAWNISSINPAIGSSLSDSRAAMVPEAELPASEALSQCSLSLFLLRPLSTDPVLEGGRVLCLADGAAAAARRELEGDIVRVSGDAQTERAGRWAHERLCETAGRERRTGNCEDEPKKAWWRIGTRYWWACLDVLVSVVPYDGAGGPKQGQNLATQAGATNFRRRATVCEAVRTAEA